jgi:hypothetical protein
MHLRRNQNRTGSGMGSVSMALYQSMPDDVANSDQNPADRLFGRLLEAPGLRVTGGLCRGYRNKITYNVPIVEWSDLAEERLNDICRSVQCWQQQQQQQNDSTPPLTTTATTIREVMVKVSRQNEFMVRVTVQQQEALFAAPPADDDDGSSLLWPASFRDFMLSRHPQIVCLCYNIMSGGGAKPSKDYDSYHFLTPQKFLRETKPTMVDGEYCQMQISPDTFSEVNTNVEDLQFQHKKAWLENEAVADVLLVSGRDVCSFGLLYRRRRRSSNHQNHHHNQDQQQQQSQSQPQDVVAIQHDPLVHRDALINLHRDDNDNDNNATTVLLASKATMVQSLLECTKLITAQSIHCVTTGGRHGMNPAYLQYLVGNAAIQIILYNSCNTKSLVRDMRGFITGGFRIEDFRSFDLFPGTNFTASVTKLKRRPRTLVLPIGPAGVGTCVAFFDKKKRRKVVTRAHACVLFCRENHAGNSSRAVWGGMLSSR